MSASVGDWIYTFFGSIGDAGILIGIFLIFFIDAIVFPAMPELFFVLAFINRHGMSFGLELLGVAVIAEILGVALLYYIVGHIGIPKRINKLVNKYIDFLIFGDERLILLNRVAPMIPFCGAFIRIAGWNIKKSLLYVAVGCLIKYGAILLMSKFFFDYFSSGEAVIYTLAFVFAVIIISFMLSIIYKKRNAIG